MDIGIWGLGRMGFNMARRLVDSGEHRVIAGNRSPGKVDDAVEQGAESAYSVEELIQKLNPPRVLWSMLPAGDVTDQMIDRFIELADEGDIIIDGANSYFRDSIRRAEKVRNAGLRWLLHHGRGRRRRLRVRRAGLQDARAPKRLRLPR
jgi:6-phosphogluconate dehydrogenase